MGIIDQRSYRQLFGRELDNNAKAEEYFLYIQKCIEVSRLYKIPFETIDKILYQKDKEENNRLKR